MYRNKAWDCKLHGQISISVRWKIMCYSFIEYFFHFSPSVSILIVLSSSLAWHSSNFDLKSFAISAFLNRAQNCWTWPTESSRTVSYGSLKMFSNILLVCDIKYSRIIQRWPHTSPIRSGINHELHIRCNVMISTHPLSKWIVHNNAEPLNSMFGSTGLNELTQTFVFLFWVIWIAPIPRFCHADVSGSNRKSVAPWLKISTSFSNPVWTSTPGGNSSKTQLTPFMWYEKWALVFGKLRSKESHLIIWLDDIYDFLMTK